MIKTNGVILYDNKANKDLTFRFICVSICNQKKGFIMNNIKKRMLMYKKLLIMALMSSSLALTGCNQNQENVELVNSVDSTAEYNEDEFEYLNIDFENCINNNTKQNI